MKSLSALNNGFLSLSLGAIFVGLVKVDQFDIVNVCTFSSVFCFLSHQDGT